MIEHQPADTEIRLRRPEIADGAGMWRIVKASGVLDLNSSYLYLLMAREFADTCVVAEDDGEIVGFVIGYRRLERPEAVFLWQVGILPSAQGKGLGKRLLAAFLRAPGCAGAQVLETTITPENTASRALFHAVARDLGVECEIYPCFSADHFPETGHEDEELFDIGPFSPEDVEQLDY